MFTDHSLPGTFPAYFIRAGIIYEREDTEECPLFTFKELEEAILSVKDSKASGPNAIPSEALKLVF